MCLCICCYFMFRTLHSSSKRDNENQLTSVQDTFVIINTHIVAMCSCATDVEKNSKSWCKPIEICMQMNHGNTNNKQRLHTWFWWSRKHSELPNRSPELVVTKTQLSLRRKKRRRVWWFRGMFTVDLSSLFARLSWTDEHRQLGCQIITSHIFLSKAHRSLVVSHKHQYRGTLILFRSPLSHPSPLIYFRPFPSLSHTHKRTN